MERKKYVKNLEEFIIELKSIKEPHLKKDDKWENDIEEFEAISKKYRIHENKKKY